MRLYTSTNKPRRHQKNPRRHQKNLYMHPRHRQRRRGTFAAPALSQPLRDTWPLCWGSWRLCPAALDNDRTGRQRTLPAGTVASINRLQARCRTPGLQLFVVTPRLVLNPGLFLEAVPTGIFGQLRRDPVSKHVLGNLVYLDSDGSAYFHRIVGTVAPHGHRKITTWTR